MPVNWLDWVILGGAVLAAVQGYHRGLVREVLGLACTALIFILGFHYGVGIGENLGAVFGFAPGPLSGVVGFLATSLAVSVVSGLVIFVWRRFADWTRLAGLDSLGGAVLGVAKAWLVALIVLVLLSTVSPAGFGPVVRSSRIAPEILKAAPVLYAQVEKFLPTWPAPVDKEAEPERPRSTPPWRLLMPRFETQPVTPPRGEWRET